MRPQLPHEVKIERRITEIDARAPFRYTGGMFGISFEHVLVLGIILLFVGPRRLPQLGNTLGKAIKNFKDGVSGVENAAYRKLDETQKMITTPPKPVESSERIEAEAK